MGIDDTTANYCIGLRILGVKAAVDCNCNEGVKGFSSDTTI